MILNEEIEVNLGSKVEEASHVKVAILSKKKEFVYDLQFTMANFHCNIKDWKNPDKRLTEHNVL